MAAPITTFKNPITASTGSIFDWHNWVGGMLWVVMVGFILSFGVKAFNMIDDKVVPGNNAPNIRAYQPQQQQPGVVVL